MSESKSRSVNPILSESPRIGPLSAKQFFVLGGGFGATFFWLGMIFGLPMLWSVLLSLWVGLTLVLITGDKEWETWGKFWPPTPKWVAGSGRYTSAVGKQKIGTRRIRSAQGKVQRYTPFEDDVHLITYLRLEEAGHKFGAGVLSNSNDSVQIIIGFDYLPIHCQILPDQVDAIFDPIEAVQKELPRGEHVTFNFSSFRCDENRQCELSEAIEKASIENQDAEFLLWNERTKVRQLTKDGIRREQRYWAYFTLTLNLKGSQPQGFLDRSLSNVLEFWQRRFASKGKEITKKRLISLIRKASEAAIRYEQLLSKIGLQPTMHDDRRLWQDLSERLGNPDPVDVPHVLILDKNGLRQEFYREKLSAHLERKVAVQPGDEVHASSLLISHGVPQADPQWVCIRNKQGEKKYIAVLVLSQRPGGWPDKAAQLCYLREISNHSDVYDIEIVTQATLADEGLTRSKLQMITQRSRGLDLAVQERSRTFDVVAQETTKRSVDAERRIYEGDLPVHLAVTILVYRDTLEELDDACRAISGYVFPPAKIVRETNYAWNIWLQALMVRREALLLRPFNRRLTFFGSESPALLNLAGIRTTPQLGVELYAVEGGTPVRIDVHPKEPQHVFIAGITGSGKSALLAKFILDAIVRDMACMIIDSPNQDGIGSFTALVKFLGGDYYDISRKSLNAMEVPDLRGLPPEQQEERFSSNKQSIKSFIEALVLGADRHSGLLPHTIRSLISLIVEAFFQDIQILNRYNATIKAGFGSGAWRDTPTLIDLLPFCSKACLDLSQTAADNIEEAIEYIKLRLLYWIQSSIGNAIAKPSSFKSDSKLICFALTGISNDEQAAALALLAYAAANRQSLRFPSSVVAIDELSVLSKYDGIANYVGEVCAQGRKAGRSVILSAQDPDSVLKCSAADQIFQNLTTRVIGLLSPVAVKSFASIFGYPHEIINKNAGTTFISRKDRGSTRWLVERDATFTTCDYYPPNALLALAANNRAEVAARDRFFTEYPDKYQALAAFSKHYISCIRQGRPL